MVKKKLLLTPEQKEVFKWLYYLQLGSLYETIAALLNERGKKEPNQYFTLYEAMSEEKQSEVLLMLSRTYYNRHEDSENEDIEQLIELYSYS